MQQKIKYHNFIKINKIKETQDKHMLIFFEVIQDIKLIKNMKKKRLIKIIKKKIKMILNPKNKHLLKCYNKIA